MQMDMIVKFALVYIRVNWCQFASDFFYEKDANHRMRTERSIRVRLDSLIRRYAKTIRARFMRDVHVLFAAVCYQNHHILDHRNRNLSRENFFQLLI